jgi:hypothetical protein
MDWRGLIRIGGDFDLLRIETPLIPLQACSVIFNPYGLGGSIRIGGILTYWEWKPRQSPSIHMDWGRTEQALTKVGIPTSTVGALVVNCSGFYPALRLTAAVDAIAPLPFMSAVGGTLWLQRCPLQRPLRVGLLSPPRSSVSLFMTLNIVLWVHE